ncbi:YfjI family protein [Hyphomicrobium sp. MC1]|uniref:YfjI family protein n=1 Tax=Hyphomicrobium sp. (strain MC1) TaxID=717785 RepID=UPI00059DCCEF|nr:YfjI family protein [Hyphomicrobium sp. MC1]
MLEAAGLTGIDFDHCISDSGSFSSLAAATIELGETYGEISPSGEGVHLLALGKAPTIKRDDIRVEVYTAGRYFTFTGDQIDGTPNIVASAPNTLAHLSELAASTAKPSKTAAPVYLQQIIAGGDFFANVNGFALQRLDAWVPALHPTARKQATGAWRVTSQALGRNLEEDLSYHPSGISDHGEEHGLTAIDAVMRFGNERDAASGARWLCQRMGIEPAALGWKGERGAKAATPIAQSATPAIEDDEPLPLTRPLPAANSYPEDALGPLKHAAIAIQAATQGPFALAANAVIAAAAHAGQAHVNVLLPTGQEKPISVFLIGIAESGERKTTIDNFATQPTKQRQRELVETYREELGPCIAKRKAWEAQTRQISNDKKLDYPAKEKAIAALGPEPPMPLQPFLIVSDITIEGMTKLLIDGQPSIGVFATEGGVFTGGHALKDEAKLSTGATMSLIWDDGTFSRTRALEGATFGEGRRLSLHLQIQPDAGMQFYNDRTLSDQGLIWRFLPAAPDSTQGQRLWRERDVGHNSALDDYYQRLTELLKAPPNLRPGTRNELAPRALVLSPDARQLWITFANEIERRVGPDGDLRPIAGLANKLLEHATRLAGILTVYADLNAREIDRETMERGFDLATYYAQTALRLRNAASVNAELVEADQISQWMRDKWKAAGERYISVTDLVQHGPNAIRDTTKAGRIISILEQHRHLRSIEGPREIKGKTRRKVWEIRT